MVGTAEGMRPRTAICTWFVADTEADATYFPQIGLHSSNAKSQEVYWKCIACFFVSSKARNPRESHVFFTNTTIPTVDGLDIRDLFKQVGVEVIHIPITYRLKRPDITSWGNQFYILDILKYLSDVDLSDRYIVLDSDCLWLQSAEQLCDDIDRFGVLTYELGNDIYRDAESINGCTRQEMALTLRQIGGPERPSIPYFGGEIFAGTAKETARLAGQVDFLWTRLNDGSSSYLKEEAHFLSVLYALNGYQAGTADRYIKRMWTTFKHNNLSPTDRDLVIWHLPSEKKSGFSDMFDHISRSVRSGKSYADGIDAAFYGRVMGVPKRNSAKLIRDLSVKVLEKARR